MTKPLVTIIIFLSFSVGIAVGQRMTHDKFPFTAPPAASAEDFRLKTNLLLWAATIPNIGAEYGFSPHWSATLDVWYSPWKISKKFGVKTVAVLPSFRYWLRPEQSGSYFNLHANVAWFNVYANAWRYQDTGTPLLGAGIGYGYRLRVNHLWGFEFEIGAGFSHAKYERYYNISNGALKDTRKTTYFGIDRASVAITYNL